MKRVLSIALCGAISACASAPDKISANYVSPMQYGSYDCSQIREEMLRVSANVHQVAGVQSRAHTRDEVAVGVGLVLFWPALFFLAEGDKKEELASLKGQYDALEQAAIQKRCSELTDQIASDRARAESHRAAAAAVAPAAPSAPAIPPAPAAPSTPAAPPVAVAQASSKTPPAAAKRCRSLLATPERPSAVYRTDC